jgi:hypothetical protein
MIHWVTPDSTGVVKMSSLDELPSPSTFREYRTVNRAGQIIRLTGLDAQKVLQAGFDVTVIDHRVACACDYCEAQVERKEE